MRRKFLLFLALTAVCRMASAQIRMYAEGGEGLFPLVDGESAQIVVSKADGITVEKVARLFADDVWRVTGNRPQTKIADKPKGKYVVAMGTIEGNPFLKALASQGTIDVAALKGGWEQYMVHIVDSPTKGVDKALVIVGSDRRGVAYGTFAVSEAIGVSPWYWWADVPVRRHDKLFLSASVVSEKPSVKYRGVFINDEDWGMKPWSEKTFEKELGDIGPRTYAKVCELLLRLKANMLAPAMHSCTGAFYSHPESKLVADSFGIVITTSHCEPLLLNNAAKSEWDQNVDGDWNYKTNKQTIIDKWEKRLAEAARFENIYTTAMRGLHDAGLRGNLPMNERVPLIEDVIADQRRLLERHKSIAPEEIPQIFVPYKETMDIYENGLRVPDDITLVWVDDNYGYMKRVSSPQEQLRSGGAGVYYHISYLGAPHDYLWLCTTPPVLMYEELKKAYDTGADRYWLLNVGDIKPMELGIQTFMDMAWDIHRFDIDNVNHHQSQLLAAIYGDKYLRDFQLVLDKYYQLAWSRKPEFMGWEREWDSPEYTRLNDTEYSFDNYNEAQQRLHDYGLLADLVTAMESDMDESLRPSFFEMVGYPVKAAHQMNRKFLMAQLNHELADKGEATEANWAARQAKEAYDSIQSLTSHYNSMLCGKWNAMMDLAPGLCALYQRMPEVLYTEGIGETEVDLSCVAEKRWSDKCHVVDLSQYKLIDGRNEHQVRIVDGIGYDWHVLQLGKPTEAVEDPANPEGTRVEYTFPTADSDSVDVYLYTVPFFPMYNGRGTTIGVSVDGCQPKVYNNDFQEYSLEWKNQVLQNGDVAKMRFAVDKTKKKHTLSLVCGDPGQMIQKVIIDSGGLKPSYIGPPSLSY